MHGLFDVWSFRRLDAVVSSGLGGGSLIYANVLLRKDEKWFVRDSPLPGGGYESWPVTRADLDSHYDQVERMLQPQRYPFAVAPYDRTAKTRAMRDAAEHLHLQWQLPPLAVSFAPTPLGRAVIGAPIPDPEYGNLHGLQLRRTCRLCGECDIGCNDGAKNTLDHTHLSAARHHGADVRTRHEVRELAPRSGGGFTVRYVVHEGAPEGRRTKTSQLPRHTITSDRLVLAAGALGTSWLLLRNRAALPGLGPLGTRFSGNGDLLAFVLRAHHDDGTGRRLGGASGPVITSAIRLPDALDGGGAQGRGCYVQDAGYPGFVDWLVESAQWPGQLRRLLAFAIHRAWAIFSRSPKTSVAAHLSALLGDGALSDASLPLLGMGRDVPDGRLLLRRGHLDVDWTLDTSQEYFGRLSATMRDVADALHGEFQGNSLGFFRKVITVHPVAGAPMGRDAREGVVDAFGEVFGWPGLYIADGAAVSGPVGPNPSLTIAALADRLADRALADGPRATTVGLSRSSGPLPPPSADAEPDPPVTGLEFTEEMKGFVELGVVDPVEGERLGRAKEQRLMLHLTIDVDDVERFAADPKHEARADGWIHCDELGGRLPVTAGWFNLFTRDPAAIPRGRAMHYRLHVSDGAGRPLTLIGHKDVYDDPGWDVWRDTSTLFTSIVAGHVDPATDDIGQTVAVGVVTIHVPDFIRQLTTFRTHGPNPVGALERFGRLFLGELRAVYGTRLGTAVGA